MAILVDSYSETNQDTFYAFYDTTKHGQAFTGTGGRLNSAKFYLKKAGSPTGACAAKIYTETHATAFGTDSKPPDGTPSITKLAISTEIDVATLPTDFALVTFTFTGANKIILINGTYYIVTFEFTGGDISNLLELGCDSTGTHNGNASHYNGNATWSENTAGYDICFYVYKDAATLKDIIQSGIIPSAR